MIGLHSIAQAWIVRIPIRETFVLFPKEVRKYAGGLKNCRPGLLVVLTYG